MPWYCARIRSENKKYTRAIHIFEASSKEAECFFNKTYPTLQLLSMERFNGEPKAVALPNRDNIKLS